MPTNLTLRLSKTRLPNFLWDPKSEPCLRSSIIILDQALTIREANLLAPNLVLEQVEELNLSLMQVLDQEATNIRKLSATVIHLHE